MAFVAEGIHRGRRAVDAYPGDPDSRTPLDRRQGRRRRSNGQPRRERDLATVQDEDLLARALEVLHDDAFEIDQAAMNQIGNHLGHWSTDRLDGCQQFPERLPHRVAKHARPVITARNARAFHPGVQGRRVGLRTLDPSAAGPALKIESAPRPDHRDHPADPREAPEVLVTGNPLQVMKHDFGSCEPFPAVFRKDPDVLKRRHQQHALHQRRLGR